LVAFVLGFIGKAVKGVAKVLGGSGPLVKAEGIADQLQDKWAERVAAGAFALVAIAMIVMAFRC